jgi:hypothetical protein
MQMGISIGQHNNDRQALDTERQRQNKEGGDRTKAPLLFLKGGITQVRILPAYSDKGVWFKEIRKHFLGKGFGSPPCFSYFGAAEPCPYCAKVEELRDEGTEASVKASSALAAQRKYLFNAVVFSAPPEVEFEANSIYVLEAGVTVKKQLVELDTDPQLSWENITDIAQGVNISIKKVGKGLDTRYTVTPVGQRSNLAELLEARGIDITKLQMHDLDDVFVKPSEVDVKEAFDTILNTSVASKPAEVPQPAAPGPSAPAIPPPPTAPAE